jgi:ribosomal protein S18 acetylase RimI-like enzyme
LLTITHLPWDTEFFGVAIARTEVNGIGIDAAFEAARREEIECLYVFVPGAPPGVVMQAIAAGAQLVDLRTELKGVVRRPAAEAFAQVATRSDLPALEELAARLAEASRFRADPRFAADAVAEMYRIWVRLCLEEGVVVIAQDSSGFVGARRDAEEALVELVYVAPDARGANIGRRLVTAAVHELDARSARVVTSVGNVAAQRLYQSIGFRTQSVEAVLHLWVREAAQLRDARSPH